MRAVLRREATHNIVTVGWLGIIAYSVTYYVHEVIGHGVTMRIFGQHHVFLTAGYIDSNDAIQSSLGRETAQRVIAAMGSVANLVAGILFFWISLRAAERGRNATIRYGLWLLTAINLFFGSSYMVYSGIVGVADWAGVIAGLPAASYLRVTEVICGTALCTIAYKIARRQLAAFPGNRTTLTLAPYVAAVVPYLLATLFMPGGWYSIVIGAIPAALIGQGVLPLLACTCGSEASRAGEVEGIPFSWPIAGAGIACVVLILAVAPGVRFTL